MLWHNEKRRVSELSDHPSNPRVLTERGMAQLAKSIQRNGYADAICINTDGRILSGHARRKQLVELGFDEIDVRVPERFLTEEEQRAYMIEANKATAGEWDFEILANEFEIEELADLGFTDYDLKIADLLSKSEDLEKDQHSGWTGLPVYEDGEDNPKIVVNFASKHELEVFAQRMELKVEKQNRNSYSCWWPTRTEKDSASVKFDVT